MMDFIQANNLEYEILPHPDVPNKICLFKFKSDTDAEKLSQWILDL